MWTLLMLDESRQELYYAIAAGREEASLRGLRVKVGEGVAGWVVEHGETLLVPEATRAIRGSRKSAPTAEGALGDRPAVARTQRTHGVIEILTRAPIMTDYTIAFCTFSPIMRPSPSRMRTTWPAFSS